RSAEASEPPASASPVRSSGPRGIYALLGYAVGGWRYGYLSCCDRVGAGLASAAGGLALDLRRVQSPRQRARASVLGVESILESLVLGNVVGRRCRGRG